MQMYLTKWIDHTLNKTFLREYRNCINAKQYQAVMKKWPSFTRKQSVNAIEPMPITATGLSIQMEARQEKFRYHVYNRQRYMQNNLIAPMIDRIMKDLTSS